MKIVAALLAIFGWSTAKADKLVIIQPTELEKFQAAGLIKMDKSVSGPTIEISAELMDVLKQKGRVKTLNAEASDNCGGDGKCLIGSGK